MQRVKIRKLPDAYRYFHGEYAETQGKIGIVNEHRSRNYNGVYKAAVDFLDIKNSSSQYGTFYYLEQWVEYIEECTIEAQALLELLEE